MVCSSTTDAWWFQLPTVKIGAIGPTFNRPMGIASRYYRFWLTGYRRLPAVIARVVACLPFIALLLTAMPAEAAPSGANVGVQLQVPYRSQLNGNPWELSDCGPASMAMVLAAYGKVVPTMDVRGVVNDLQGSWGDTDAGTFIETLGLVATRYGLQPIGLFKAPGVYKYEDKMLRRWSFAELRAQLDAGHPVIPQVGYRGLPGRERKPYDGDHFIVITGYQGDDFIYNDPIDKDGVGAQRRISAERLDIAWRNSDFPYAALAIAGSTAKQTVTPVPSPTAIPAPPRAPGILVSRAF